MSPFNMTAKISISLTIFPLPWNPRSLFPLSVSAAAERVRSQADQRPLKRKSGNILLNGQDIASVKHAAGYMPQKDLLFPWRTIEKNLCLPMEIAKVPQSEQIQRVSDILKEVGLSDYAAKYPKDLSGGMRQRISFARTLLTDADLLLLDEPFSALGCINPNQHAGMAAEAMAAFPQNNYVHHP